MGQHLILGAGGIGIETAIALSRRGEQVTIGSRSGTDPGLPGVRAIAVDATDADAITAASKGADSIINAMNPKSYVHWDRDWPPVATAVLAAAQRSGAGLVTVSRGMKRRGTPEGPPIRLVGSEPPRCGPATTWASAPQSR